MRGDDDVVEHVDRRARDRPARVARGRAPPRKAYRLRRTLQKQLQQYGEAANNTRQFFPDEKLGLFSSRWLRWSSRAAP